MKRIRPRKMKTLERKARALAAANRRAYLGVAVCFLLSIPIIIICISVVPTGSPRDMVKAQVVHTKDSADLHRANLGPPATLSATNGPASQARSISLKTSPQKEPGAALDNTKYASIGFDVLSAFRFVVTDQMAGSSKDRTSASSKALEQIPPAVKAFDEQEVSLKGFMLPMKVNGSLTTDFLLLKSQGLCCYGLPPKITEWVNVHMTGKGIRPIMDQPVTICGILHVGEVRENGELVGIYRLDGEKVGGP